MTANQTEISILTETTSTLNNTTNPRTLNGCLNSFVNITTEISVKCRFTSYSVVHQHVIPELLRILMNTDITQNHKLDLNVQQ